MAGPVGGGLVELLAAADTDRNRRYDSPGRRVELLDLVAAVDDDVIGERVKSETVCRNAGQQSCQGRGGAVEADCSEVSRCAAVARGPIVPGAVDGVENETPDIMTHTAGYRDVGRRGGVLQPAAGQG